MGSNCLVLMGNIFLLEGIEKIKIIFSLPVKAAVLSNTFKLGWNYFSVILKTTILFTCKADLLTSRKGTLKKKIFLVIALNTKIFQILLHGTVLYS